MNNLEFKAFPENEPDEGYECVIIINGSFGTGVWEYSTEFKEYRFTNERYELEFEQSDISHFLPIINLQNLFRSQYPY